MQHNIYIYILLMTAVIISLRVIPLTIIHKQIKNAFIRSFLYYVPYVTLAVMTFPAILKVTQSPWAALLALVAGIVAAWFGAGLFKVAIVCCVVVFVSELIIFI